MLFRSSCLRALPLKALLEVLPVLVFLHSSPFAIFLFVLFSGASVMARTSPRGSQLGNPTDDSRSIPEVEVSSLSTANIERLREQYSFSKQFELFAPGAGGRVNNLPASQVALYVEDLRAGLRFSIPEFVRNLLDYYGLCPAQLALNSVRLIISFALLCQLLPTNPRISLFRAFFVLRPHPKTRGW